MSTVEFSSKLLKSNVAPLGSAVNVSDRIRLAARRLGWSYTRTKDIWYADDRASIDGDELVTIENYTGVYYGREEVRSVEQLISSATALLERQDSDYHGPTIAAMRAFFRALAGSGARGE